MPNDPSRLRHRLQHMGKILLFTAGLALLAFLLLITLTAMFPSAKHSFGIGFINGMAALILVAGIALVKAMFGK
jgi:hypothetical protein